MLPDPVTEYRIIIHYEGIKTFDVYAHDFEQALEIARRGPEHIANAINDTVNETVVSIERLGEYK